MSLFFVAYIVQLLLLLPLLQLLLMLLLLAISVDALKTNVVMIQKLCCW